MCTNSSKCAAADDHIRNVVYECISDVDRKCNIIDKRCDRMMKTLQLCTERILQRQTKLEYIVDQLRYGVEAENLNGVEILTEIETDNFESRAESVHHETPLGRDENGENAELEMEELGTEDAQLEILTNKDSKIENVTQIAREIIPINTIDKFLRSPGTGSENTNNIVANKWRKKMDIGIRFLWSWKRRKNENSSSMMEDEPNSDYQKWILVYNEIEIN